MPGATVSPLVGWEYTTVYYASEDRFEVRMRSIRRALSFCALALSLVAASPFVAAADVTVFAAASLREAMDAQGKEFERATGNKVIVSYGASNALAKQIEAGAPADLFISADLDWMEYVAQRGLVAANARVD